MLAASSRNCVRCGTPFQVQRQWPHRKYCSPNCRSGTHYHGKAKFDLGEPVGVTKTCQHCGASFAKVHKRQTNCTPCGDKAKRQVLPHQIKAKREYFARYGRERRASDPKFAMTSRMNANIKNSLRDGKNGRRWEALVGFTITDLMVHLEAQFLPGMSWENRGEWHIDHERPLCSFEFQTPEDPQFREAWALTNLRPLWAVDNLRKGGRWEPPSN